jgi:hypothetical protein
LRIDRDGPELDRCCEKPASVGDPEGVFSDEDELPEVGVESFDWGGVYGIDAPRLGAVNVEAGAESVDLAAAPGASVSDEEDDELLDEVPS